MNVRMKLKASSKGMGRKIMAGRNPLSLDQESTV